MSLSAPRRSHARTRRCAALAVTLALLAITVQGCAHLVVLNDPLSAAEHNDLGVAYEGKGEVELARAQYQAALRKDPGMERARVNLGNTEAARGRWSNAERCYRRALEDSADDADALNNLAVALLRQSRHHEEAVELAGRAVALGGARDSIYRATLAEARDSLEARRGM